MKLPEKGHAQKVFLAYCEAYKKRDMKTIMRFFSNDSQIWGTGIDEYRIGLKAIEEQHQRDFSQSSQGVIDVVSFIHTPKEANWASGICKARITIDGKDHAFEHLRGTIIVRKENNDWKIVHMHTSFPDFRNAAQSSFPNECFLT